MLQEVGLVTSFFLTHELSVFDFLTRGCNWKLFTVRPLESLSFGSYITIRWRTLMFKWSILSRLTTRRWLILFWWWSKRTSRRSSHVSRLLLSGRRSLSWRLFNNGSVIASIFSHSYLLREANRLVCRFSFISRIVFMNVCSIHRISSLLDSWKLSSLRRSLLTCTFIRSTVNLWLGSTPWHHFRGLDGSKDDSRLGSLFLFLLSESS